MQGSRIVQQPFTVSRPAQVQRMASAPVGVMQQTMMTPQTPAVTPRYPAGVVVPPQAQTQQLVTQGLSNTPGLQRWPGQVEKENVRVHTQVLAPAGGKVSYSPPQQPPAVGRASSQTFPAEPITASPEVPMGASFLTSQGVTVRTASDPLSGGKGASVRTSSDVAPSVSTGQGLSVRTALSDFAPGSTVSSRRSAAGSHEMKLVLDALNASQRSTAASALSGRTSPEGSDGGASVPAVSRRASSNAESSQFTLGAVPELVVTERHLAQVRESREFLLEHAASTRSCSVAGVDTASEEQSVGAGGDAAEPTGARGAQQRAAEPDSGRGSQQQAAASSSSRLRSGSRQGRSVSSSRRRASMVAAVGPRATAGVRSPSRARGREDSAASAARERSESQQAREERRQRREDERRSRHQAANDAQAKVREVEGVEVVWAGANRERAVGGAKMDLEVAECFKTVVCEEKHEADARGERFDCRSPRSPRCRSPEKVAHSRVPSHQVEEDWRTSLCEERSFRGEEDFVVPRARSSSRSVSVSRRSESPACSSLRGSSVDGSRRARSLSVAMFGPVDTWPLGSQPGVEKATEQRTATGQVRLALLERPVLRRARTSVAEPESRIKRQYMREVVDATGKISFCVSERDSSKFRSSPRPSSARPANVARHTADALGVRRHMLVEGRAGSTSSPITPR